jgi:DNA helicase-2/ATP-dependent DNA helicase PcrA
VLSQATNVTQAIKIELGSKQPHEGRGSLRKSFSFTSDIQAFETCKRQYKLFNLLEFSPSRALTILFGTLVHQTIEDIHKTYIRGDGKSIDTKFIEERFEINYKMLQLKEVRFMAEAQKRVALKQVVSYWTENIDYLHNVKEAEVEVTIEKEGYILNGAIDLVSSDGEDYEIVDFKTGAKPDQNNDLVKSYYNQLCIYAHILSRRSGKPPVNLVLYWTGEMARDKARMVFKYKEDDVVHAMDQFESVVKRIQSQNFDMDHAPDPKICNECDFKNYCKSTGLIR